MMNVLASYTDGAMGTHDAGYPFVYIDVTIANPQPIIFHLRITLQHVVDLRVHSNLNVNNRMNDVLCEDNGIIWRHFTKNKLGFVTFATL